MSKRPPRGKKAFNMNFWIETFLSRFGANSPRKSKFLLARGVAGAFKQKPLKLHGSRFECISNRKQPVNYTFFLSQTIRA